MELSKYSNAWTQGEDRTWRSSTVDSVSYPSDGNEDCFKVEEQSFWFRHRNKIIAGLVANFPPRDLFFDVGGGNGFVAKAIQDEGHTTVLVEPGGGGVANARRRGVANVVQSMWTPELINPESASAVGLFDVVEHIDDDLQFLKGVHQTLEVNGLVFITVPAYRLLWSYEDVYAGHFRRYRLPQLRRLLSQSGFKVEFSTYFFSPLPLPIFFQRTIPSFLGLRKQANLQTTTNEHTQNRGLTGRIVDRLLSREERGIARLKPMLVGSSCAIVGRKIKRA